MASSGLAFENDSNTTLSASGYGKDGVCLFTGQQGENSDRMSYDYDVRQGHLKISTHLTDMAKGTLPEVSLLKKDMTPDQAILFSNVMDAAVSARMAEQYPDAVSFNQARGPDGKRLDSNGVKGLFNDASKDAERMTSPKGTALDNLGDFFGGIAALEVVDFKQAQSMDMDHLQGTNRLSLKDDPDRCVFLNETEDRIDVWDMAGAKAAPIEPTRTGLAKGVGQVAEHLGVDKEMSTSVKSLQASANAYEEWGLAPMGVKANKATREAESLLGPRGLEQAWSPHASPTQKQPSLAANAQSTPTTRKPQMGCTV
ncbi:MAG: hypothetical protein AB7E52_06520 [Bdellovibrionales bacterium]